MRTCLVMILAIGCGDDTNKTTGTNGGADMTVKVLKDMSAMNAACDVAMQDCMGGQKCIPMFDTSTGEVSGGCVANGTVAAGGTCMVNTTVQGSINDNCVAGFICDDLFGNQGLACRKACALDSDCAAGEACGDFLSAQGLSGETFGWCVKTCAAFSTDAGNCPTGMDCGENFFTVDQPDPNTPSGFFFCKKTGTSPVYGSCATDGDCGANTWCGIIDPNASGGVCIPNCSDTVTCVSPPADLGVTTATCQPLLGTVGGAGFCNVQ